MRQKKVNERIAMAMLRLCALVWEHWTKVDNEGEFKMSDIMQGRGRTAYKSKPGYVFFGLGNLKYPDVFNRNMRKIDGVKEYESDTKIVKMFFQTDDHAPIGYGLSYPVDSVFEVTRDFCKINACQSLLNKIVFGKDSSGMWARLPKTKPKAKVVKPTPKAELSLTERLREALLKQLKQAA